MATTIGKESSIGRIPITIFSLSWQTVKGDSNIITEDTVWRASSNPYLITENLIIASSTTLTIEPGVVVKLAQASIFVDGHLIIQGTEERPVIFTSVNDDARGGQAVSWSSGEPQIGDWGGIETRGDGTLKMEYTVVNYGGQSYVAPVKNNLIKLNTVYAQSYYHNIGAITIGGREATINHSSIFSNTIGILVYGHASVAIHNTGIFSNSQGGLLNYGSTQVDATHNWWGNESGPYHEELNPDGEGDKVVGDVLFTPWIGQPEENRPPAITFFGQFKSDATIVLPEQGTSTKGIIYFKARVDDQDDAQVKIEVSIEKYLGFFLGDEYIVYSLWTPTSSMVVASTSNLSDGQYQWRVRAIDKRGLASQWYYFGAGGPFEITYDFAVQSVPLYTQVESPYPFRLPEDEWAQKKYAFGLTSYSCSPGTQAIIKKCGCAITSMVMLGRYYGINIGIDNSEVNPLNINHWLEQNHGYVKGSLIWKKAIEYLGFKNGQATKVVLSHDYYNARPQTQKEIIDNYILNNRPAIAYSSLYGHYFVLDSKIKTSDGAITYGVRDPYWYETKTLNQKRNVAAHIQNYYNTFAKANLFSYLDIPQTLAASLELRLASPAELLLIDPSGRRLGRDPRHNQVYNEIPGGIYTTEGDIVSSESELQADSLHQTKVIYLPQPIAGDYQVQVVGTGEGDYTLTLLAYDENGHSQTKEKTGFITASTTDNYNLSFNPADTADNTLEIADSCLLYSVA